MQTIRKDNFTDKFMKLLIISYLSDVIARFGA